MNKTAAGKLCFLPHCHYSPADCHL